MGYNTSFTGYFDVSPQLTPAQVKYLLAFSQTRRMARSSKMITRLKLEDPLRLAVGLPLGPEGAMFVGGGGDSGQKHDGSVVDVNRPPKGQPSLWCQWVPSDDGTRIEWDGGDKFYEYTEWIMYIIGNIMKRWKRVLNGTVEWVGEDYSDLGRIVITDNEVTVQMGKVVYE